MARKGKRGGITEDLHSDMPATEKRFKEMFGEIDAAQKDFEEANSKAQGLKAIMRNKLKVAYALGEKLGHDKATINAYRLLRHRVPDEIDRETRALNALCRLMDLPLGTQLGLFDDGSTVANAVDTAKLAEAGAVADLPNTAHGAYDLGFAAGRQGADPTSNPYPLGAPFGRNWADGWEDGQAEIALSMAPAGDDDPDFAEVEGAAPDDASAPIKLPTGTGRKRGRPPKAATTETGAAAH